MQGSATRFASFGNGSCYALAHFRLTVAGRAHNRVYKMQWVEGFFVFHRLGDKSCFLPQYRRHQGGRQGDAAESARPKDAPQGRDAGE
jgi:hypothetical protein